MKPCLIRNLYVLLVQMTCLGSLVGQMSAQTFTTLHTFAGPPYDGAGPYSSMILSGNTLYGTTQLGGASGNGTLFSIKTDGTGFTNLHYFDGSQGANPSSCLVLSGNTLYGTTTKGGGSGNGTVFKINTDGTGFSALYDFSGGIDGALPQAGLALTGSILYGTANAGGAFGNGTVFAVNTDGTGFKTLHAFSAPAVGLWTNSDGAGPYARLMISGNTLYGTAEQGGVRGQGTVFKLNTDGTDFTVIHTFTAAPYGTNGDGSSPYAGLTISGNTLYGTTYSGGNLGGTVFAINLDGSGFTTLYAFPLRTPDSSGIYTNSDGANPYAELFLSGNTLYGTASTGGSSGNGTVFAVNTDGSGFTNLHSFGVLGSDWGTNGDGATPVGGLLLSGNTLYGTTYSGGAFGAGAMFSVSLPPQLVITPSDGKVVVTWPVNPVRFTLQCTTNLGPSAVWTTNSIAPVVVNGLNTVTSPISGTQQFFRLSQ